MARTSHFLLVLLLALFPASKAWSQHKCGIDISLWGRLSTQPDDSTTHTAVNIGLYSSINRLNGISLNMLGGNVREKAYGLQTSGLWNTTSLMNGLQIAGLANVNATEMKGVSVAGLVSINGNCTHGVTAAGLANIGGNNQKGVSIGGLLNIAGNNSAGLQLSAMANISGGNIRGMSASGLLNIAGTNMHGMQLATLLNVTGEEMQGIQIGLGNFATKARGLQIGLINYYQTKMDGLQLGLVNANPHTEVTWMLFGGNDTKLNLGARFKNNLLYTILGAGMPYFGFNDRLAAAFFYRAGIEVPLLKRLSLSGDIGFRHIETFANHKHDIPARLYSLQGRVNLSYRLTGNLSVFATGGYSWDREYRRNSTFRHGTIWEGGIAFHIQKKKGKTEH